MKIGLGATEAANLLKTMESMSSASRETLQSQLESTAQLIRQQGVAPGAVMKDVAANAEFFALHSKAGSDNLFIAAAQARKLGLNLGTASQIAEGLMDFESSIAAQTEASVMLGRELNFDRARQLMLTDDIAGMMTEVRKQVGTEAEFANMSRLEREATAKALQISTQDLSKLVAEEETAGKVAAEIKWSWVGIGAAIGAIIGMIIGGLTMGVGLPAMFSGMAAGAAGAAGIGAGIGVLSGAAVGAIASFQGLPVGTGVNITGGAAMAHAGETIVRTESINMDKTNQLLGDLVVLNERMIRKIDGIGVS